MAALIDAIDIKAVIRRALVLEEHLPFNINCFDLTSHVLPVSV